MTDNNKNKEQFIEELKVAQKKISDLEKASEQLKTSKEKAEESDRLKSTFLVNMSHEIRTPMNAILGFAELLKEPDFDEEKKSQFIDIINIKCKHLLTIIDDLIDISKIEANLITIESKECTINTIFKDLFSIYSEEVVKLNKAHIKLYVQNGLRDEDCGIYTDEIRLRQILSNLVSNALKYTEDGYIEFGYSVENSKTLKFYVKDTGIGIPKAKQKIIFDRFKQEDDGYTRQFGGTGLGLAISKRLVKLMDGEIWVESEGGDEANNLPILSVIRPDGREVRPGKGSTFYFTIPYKSTQKSVETKKEEIIKKGKYNWKGKLILIVEDDSLSFKYLDTFIKNTNAEIIQAYDGREAVQICKSNPDIDLVLMDIQLPVMNGFKATLNIKKIRPELPVIAQTAYASTDDEKKSYDAGCDDYISKPISSIKILKILSKYLQG